MKILTPGHKYALAWFEGADARPEQTIQFIQKEGEPLATLHNGTTNEEVLTMLIDRARFLHDKLPSRETAIAITKMEEALLWFNHRTQLRKQRGVEGTHKA